MPRKPAQKLKQIASDDEISDSGPDVSDVSGNVISDISYKL